MGKASSNRLDLLVVMGIEFIISYWLLYIKCYTFRSYLLYSRIIQLEDALEWMKRLYFYMQTSLEKLRILVFN